MSPYLPAAEALQNTQRSSLRLQQVAVHACQDMLQQSVISGREVKEELHCMHHDATPEAMRVM